MKETWVPNQNQVSLYNQTQTIHYYKVQIYKKQTMQHLHSLIDSPPKNGGPIF